MPTVIGLRGMDIDGRVHDTENSRSSDASRGQEGGYDDTLVILHPDGRVERMPYSSHPFQNNSGASPDVDGDRRGDVGTIRPGEYYARSGGSHAGDSSWHVRQSETTTDADGRVHMTYGDDHIPAWRDTNHDHRIDDAERTASETPRRGRAQNESPSGDYADQVLFHQIRPGVRTDSSIACQVMPRRTFGDFKDAMGPRQDFNYVLVDVNDPERQPSP